MCVFVVCVGVCVRCVCVGAGDLCVYGMCVCVVCVVCVCVCGCEWVFIGLYMCKNAHKGTIFPFL